MATAQLGEWENGSIRALLIYDDVTFVVSRLELINEAAQRCRFTGWRDDMPQAVVQALVQPGQTRSFNVNVAAGYRYEPIEREDGVTPAGNVAIRLEYPA